MTGILATLIGQVFAGGGGGGYTIVQTFTATSTWTCPTGVTEVEYLVVAGGGGVGEVDLVSPRQLVDETRP